MSILRKNKQKQLPTQLVDPEPQVTSSAVLDYLAELSPEDYKKIFEVASVYRKANEDAAQIWGIENKPTVTLDALWPDADDDGPTIEEPNFLDDEPKLKVKNIQVGG